MRRILALFSVVVVAVGVYVYRRDNASDCIRKEMLGIVSDMDLSPEDSDTVSRLVNRFHNQVFEDHFDPKRAHGKKFDVNGYYNDIGTRIAETLGADGQDELAHDFRLQQSGFTLTVTER